MFWWYWSLPKRVAAVTATVSCIVAVLFVVGVLERPAIEPSAAPISTAPTSSTVEGTTPSVEVSLAPTGQVLSRPTEFDPAGTRSAAARFPSLFTWVPAAQITSIVLPQTAEGDLSLYMFVPTENIQGVYGKFRAVFEKVNAEISALTGDPAVMSAFTAKGTAPEGRFTIRFDLLVQQGGVVVTGSLTPLV